MATEFYLWQWSPANVPARPSDIADQLATGDTPSAIQPFLVRRVYARLFDVRTQYQDRLSEIYVDPYAAEPGATRYIRFRLPCGNSADLARKLLAATWDAELTVFNATDNRLVGLPKRNVVEFPGGRQFIDIDAADVPGLLHELAGHSGLTALACYDSDGNMFQVWSHQRRYAVEWQVVPCRDFKLHRLWVAGRDTSRLRRARLGTLEAGLDLYSQELLEVAEVHRLWVTFLRGAPRPESHRWRDITRQPDQPGQPRRYRDVAWPAFSQN